MAAAGQRADPRLHRPRHRRPPPRPRRRMGHPHRLPRPTSPGRPGTGPPPSNSSRPSSPGSRQQAATVLTLPPEHPRRQPAHPDPQPRGRPSRTSATSCGSRTTRTASNPTTKPWSCTSGSATDARKAIVAFNLGHAYKDIPALRDLDQAEHWYQRDLRAARRPRHPRPRARTTGQLGNVAYQRFIDARDAGEPAASSSPDTSTTPPSAYQQALELLPPDAVSRSRRHPSPARQHLRRCWGHRPRAPALPAVHPATGAPGQPLRRRGRAAITPPLALAKAGPLHDALLYARAALRDYEAVGPGAAARRRSGAPAHHRLEQEPPGGPEPSTEPA